MFHTVMRCERNGEIIQRDIPVQQIVPISGTITKQVQKPTATQAYILFIVGYVYDILEGDILSQEMEPIIKYRVIIDASYYTLTNHMEILAERTQKARKKQELKDASVSIML